MRLQKGDPDEIKKSLGQQQLAELKDVADAVVDLCQGLKLPLPPKLGLIVNLIQQKEQAMNEQQKGISLKPSDATQGGGLFDDVDVLVKEVRTALWDYNGQIQVPVPALKVTFAREDGEFQQHYSAGDAKNFVPSQDGKRFIPVGNSTGINESTNAMAFLMSFVNSGFPENKIGEDVSVFEGTICHVGNVPQKERKGLVQDPNKKKGTVLVVNKIHALPWETDKAKQFLVSMQQPKTGPQAMPIMGSGSGSFQAASPQAGPSVASGSVQVASNGELTGKAQEGLIAILASKGGQIAKSQLAQTAFQHFAKDPDRNALVQLMYQDAFLAAPGSPWKFDGSTVSLGG